MPTRYETAKASWETSLAALRELASATTPVMVDDALDDYINLDNIDTELVDHLLEGIYDVTTITTDPEHLLTLLELVAIVFRSATSVRPVRLDLIPLLVALHKVDTINAIDEDGEERNEEN